MNKPFLITILLNTFMLNAMESSKLALNKQVKANCALFFLCRHCPSVLGEMQVKEHLFSRHAIPCYQCDEPNCSAWFGRLREMRKHIKQQHDRVYVQKKKRKQPSREKEKPKRKKGRVVQRSLKKLPFTCTLCKKQKSLLSLFREHIKRDHEIQPWHCLDCSQTFYQSDELKEHYKEDHGQELGTLKARRENGKIVPIQYDKAWKYLQDQSCILIKKIDIPTEKSPEETDQPEDSGEHGEEEYDSLAQSDKSEVLRQVQDRQEVEPELGQSHTADENQIILVFQPDSDNMRLSGDHDQTLQNMLNFLDKGKE